VSTFARPGIVTLLGILNLVGALALLSLVAVLYVGIREGGPELEGRALLKAMTFAYVLLGLAQIATGVGLLRLDPWARTAQIVLAGIGLLGIPCGTIISILILMYMLKPEVKTLFSGVSPQRLSPEQVARVEQLSRGFRGVLVPIIAGVVIMGGIVFASIVAAIVIPSLVRAQVSANEKAAIASLRAVRVGEETYAIANDGFGDKLECLTRTSQCLPGHSATSPRFLNERYLIPERNGYEFRFLPGPPAPPHGRISPSSLEGWAYVAVPVRPGETGIRSFCTDMAGRLCAVADGTPPDASNGVCPAESRYGPSVCYPLD
jgi:hypothetical protein